MQSPMELRCPHCGARGQVLVPGFGALVVGPCPACSEMVMLFSGCVLPLEKDIVLQGTPEEKYQHILSVLGSFVEGKAAELVEEVAQHGAAAPERQGRKAITRSEIERFVQRDLPRIDDADYFKAVFRVR